MKCRIPWKPWIIPGLSDINVELENIDENINAGCHGYLENEDIPTAKELGEYENLEDISNVEYYGYPLGRWHLISEVFTYINHGSKSRRAQPPSSDSFWNISRPKAHWPGHWRGDVRMPFQILPACSFHSSLGGSTLQLKKHHE